MSPFSDTGVAQRSLYSDTRLPSIYAYNKHKGNALQAIFASIFELELDQVPNFIEAKRPVSLAASTDAGDDGAEKKQQQKYTYLDAIQDFLAPKKLVFLKVSIPQGTASGDNSGGGKRLDFPVPAGTICVAAGPSPRGAHKHAVVGKVGKDGQTIECLFDPHPDRTGLELGVVYWAGFFTAIDPVALL